MTVVSRETSSDHTGPVRVFYEPEHLMADLAIDSSSGTAAEIDTGPEDRLTEFLRYEMEAFSLSERGFFDGELESEADQDALVDAVMNSRRVAHEIVNQPAGARSSLETVVLARQQFLVEAMAARAKEYEMLKPHAQDRPLLRAFLASPKAVEWRYKLRDDTRQILASDPEMRLSIQARDPQLLGRVARAVSTTQDNPSFDQLGPDERAQHGNDILQSDEMVDVGRMPATLIVLAEDGVKDQKTADKIRKLVRQRAHGMQKAPKTGMTGPQVVQPG